jgi:hypothetical protein
MKFERLNINHLAEFPAILKTGKRFVVWREEEKDGEATKVPYSAVTGHRASNSDPSTWSTYDEAVAYYQAHPEMHGIGREFGGDGIMGIDLDKCRDDQGHANPIADKILRAANSYTEESTSGRGFHTFVLAEHDLGGKGKKRNPKHGFELFKANCYFTITGKRVPGFPATVEKRQSEIGALFAEYFPTKTTGAQQPTSALPANDHEVLDRIQRAKNGDAVMRLWHGDTSAFGENGNSEADLALVSHLRFYTGGDRGQTERMWGQSALGKRDKWHREDYRAMTLDTAFSGGGPVYSPPAAPANGDTAIEKEWAEPVKAAPTAAKIAETVAATTIKWKDAADIYNQVTTKQKWIVSGLFPEGLVFLAGAPKMKKSWLVQDVALAVVNGGKVLNLYQAESGEVLWLALEDNHARLQKRLRTLCGNTPPPSGLRIVSADDGFPRLDRGGIEALQAYLDKFPDTTLIVCDTFQKVKPAAGRYGNAYEQDYAALTAIHKLALRNHVCVLMVHHTRKQPSSKDGADIDVFDEMSGSRGLSGVADANFILKASRGNAFARLHGVGRAIEEPILLSLEWDQAGARWKSVGGEKPQIGETRTAILDAVRAGAKKLAEIGAVLATKGFDISPANLQRTTHRMVTDGQLNKNGNEYGAAIINRSCLDCLPVCSDQTTRHPPDSDEHQETPTESDNQTGRHTRQSLYIESQEDDSWLLGSQENAR